MRYTSPFGRVPPAASPPPRRTCGLLHARYSAIGGERFTTVLRVLQKRGRGTRAWTRGGRRPMTSKPSTLGGGGGGSARRPPASRGCTRRGTTTWWWWWYRAGAAPRAVARGGGATTAGRRWKISSRTSSGSGAADSDPWFPLSLLFSLFSLSLFFSRARVSEMRGLYTGCKLVVPLPA